MTEQTNSAQKKNKGVAKGLFQEGQMSTVGAVLLYLVFASAFLARVISVSIEREIKLPIVSIVMICLLITVLPLILFVGTFAAYRAAYQRGREELEPALAWKRYALPLSLLNIFITSFLGFLLAEDIKRTDVGVLPGVFSIPIGFGSAEVLIPTSLFYLTYAGFFVYALEATRRRYVAKNLVPRFYLSSAFRWIYASAAVVLVYFSTRLGNDLLGFSDTLSGIVEKVEFMMILAFVVGMFPIEWIYQIVNGVRSRFGFQDAEPLPLSLVNGLDHTLEEFLQEENVGSIQALATERASVISNRTGIPTDTIKAWQEQAWLLNALGDIETIKRFRRLGFKNMHDLRILVDEVDFSGAEMVPVEDLATALSATDKEETEEQKKAWSIFIRVLRREYERWSGMDEE